MECDVAVLGGGPAGYTAAIRAAQLGAHVVVRRAGARARRHVPPRRLHPDEGVGADRARAPRRTRDEREARCRLGEPQLDFAAANEWKDARRQADDRRRRIALQGERRRVGPGNGRFEDATSIAFEGRRGRHLPSAIVATGSYPIRPPIPGLDSPRCVDSTGLLAQTEVPQRLVVLGGGIIGCEFASIFERFGSEVTIVEMLDTLIPQEDADAAKELAQGVHAARDRAPARQAVHAGRRHGHGAGRSFRRRRDGRVRPDARLRRARAARRGPRPGGDRGRGRPRTGIETDDHRRTSVPHIYAAGDVAGYWQLAHTGFREGEVAAENAMGHEAAIADRRCRGRSTPTPRSRASGSPRSRRASCTATTSRSACSPGSRTRARSCPARPSAGSSRSTRRPTASCSVS